MTDAPTDRLTAFVADWREIEAAWRVASQSLVRNPSPGDVVVHRTDVERAQALMDEASDRFGIDAGDVRSAGRVIAKLLEEQE